MNLTKLSTTAGVDYLLTTVTTGDQRVAAETGLTGYYTQAGNPPGQWTGRGADAAGITGLVDPGAAERLFKKYQHPVTGEVLGTGPRAKGAVAGFDLTFRIPKSVSVLWAIAPADVQAKIAAAHTAAISQALEWVEDEVLVTRSGHNGVASEQVVGMVAGRFDHWDTRDGDPHLHTHVVVSNKVQRTRDGAWLSVDSRSLHKAAVAVSEVHENLLLDELHRTLGLTFSEREGREQVVSKAAVLDVDGVPAAVVEAFSSRDRAIRDLQQAKVAEFKESHGRRPNAKETARIHAAAWRETRKPKDKVVTPLAVKVAGWREDLKAGGRDPGRILAAALDVDRSPDLSRAAVRDGDLAADYAALTLEGFAVKHAGGVVDQVRSTRATWTPLNLRAEAERLTRHVRCASVTDRRAMVDAVTTAAMSACVELTPHRYRLTGAAAEDVRVGLRGSAVFEDPANRIFTDASVLAAEGLVLGAAEETGAPQIEQHQAAALLGEISTAQERDKGYAVAPDQLAAALAVASDGRRVSAIVGPAGTGKTTTMGALRKAWEHVHGEGSVLGLTTSAQAAAVLGADLETDANTVAKWLNETVGEGAKQRAQRAAQHQKVINSLLASGPAKDRARRGLAKVMAQQASWRLRPGQLVVVDEASMTGTFALAEITRQARAAGAKVLLVGDPAQLDAVEAGGILGHLERTGKTVALTSVFRFEADWEKTASLALRQGDLKVLDTYDANGRIRSGEGDDMLEAAYQAARTDQQQGKSTVLIAATNEAVSDLNRRFTLERRATGEVSTRRLARLRAGTDAGTGEVVVARKVDRQLVDDTGDFIRNGTQLTVRAINRHGDLIARRADTGAKITIPAAWAAQNVELGYAMTAHRSQGTTVDTGHVALPAGASLNRETFYVAMTRGRQNNAAWVGIEDADHTLHAPSEQPTWRENLAQVLTAQGAELTATATREHAAEESHSLSRLAAERDHLQALAHLEQGQGGDQDWPIILRTSVGAKAAEQIENSPAKDFLLAHLTRLNRAGHDPATVLAEVASPRELATADDIAAVLAWRLERHRPDATPPVTDPVLADLLAQNQALADARRNVLAARAQTRAEAWTRHLPPPPADPERRAAWDAAVTAVAAYRDQYDITTTNPLGPTDRKSVV